MVILLSEPLTVSNSVGGLDLKRIGINVSEQEFIEIYAKSAIPTKRDDMQGKSLTTTLN
jgi:hypothetical protein